MRIFSIIIFKSYVQYSDVTNYKLKMIPYINLLQVKDPGVQQMIFVRCLTFIASLPLVQRGAHGLQCVLCLPSPSSSQQTAMSDAVCETTEGTVGL